MRYQVVRVDNYRWLNLSTRSPSAPPLVWLRKKRIISGCRGSRSTFFKARTLKAIKASAAALSCTAVPPPTASVVHTISFTKIMLSQYSALSGGLPFKEGSSWKILFRCEGFACWLNSPTAITRQGVMNGRVWWVCPQGKLALNWTDPFNTLAVGPCPSDEVANLWRQGPCIRPSRWYARIWLQAARVGRIVQCKPCANPYSADGMSKYLSAGLTQYILSKFTSKFAPHHIMENDVPVPLERFGAGNILGHQQMRGRGDALVVLYEIHRLGFLIVFLVWECKTDLQHSREWFCLIIYLIIYRATKNSLIILWINIFKWTCYTNKSCGLLVHYASSPVSKVDVSFRLVTTASASSGGLVLFEALLCPIVRYISRTQVRMDFFCGWARFWNCSLLGERLSEQY